MQELSISRLIFEAGFFVQLIMLILFCAILLALFIFAKKTVRFQFIHYRNKQFEKRFWSGSSINELFDELNQKETVGLESLFVAGFSEFRQFDERDFTQHDNVVITNCRRAMVVSNHLEVDKQERLLTILASIGSTSPYIGLLGTVYGIMHAFINLGNVKSVSINHVAPGIAEALIATAIGLMAAIPAVLAYNYFVALSDKLLVKYDAFSEEFTNVLQRQILRIKSQAQKP